jgi:hypothetical protein
MTHAEKPQAEQGPERRGPELAPAQPAPQPSVFHRAGEGLNLPNLLRQAEIAVTTGTQLSVVLDPILPVDPARYAARSDLGVERAGRLPSEWQVERDEVRGLYGQAKHWSMEAAAARERGDADYAGRCDDCARGAMTEANAKLALMGDIVIHGGNVPQEIRDLGRDAVHVAGYPETRGYAGQYYQSREKYEENRPYYESGTPQAEADRTQLLGHVTSISEMARQGVPLTPQLTEQLNSRLNEIVAPVENMASVLRNMETALAGILQLQRDAQYKSIVGTALDELKKLLERIDKGEQVPEEEKAKAFETASYVTEADSEIEGMPADARAGAGKMIVRGVSALRAGKRAEAAAQRELARALAKAKDPEQKENLERASAWLSEGKLDASDVSNMLKRDGDLRKLDSLVLGGRRQYGAEVAEIRAIDKQAAGLMKKADELREKANLEKSPAKKKELEKQALEMEGKAKQLLRTADAKTKGLLEIARFEKDLRESGAPEPVIKAVRATYRFYGTVSKWRADVTLAAAKFYIEHKNMLKGPQAAPILGALVKFLGIISGPKKDSEIGSKDKAESYVKKELEPKVHLIESKFTLDSLEKAGAPKLLVDGLRAATRFFGTKDEWRGKTVLQAAKFFLANKARLLSPQGKGPLGNLLNLVASVVKGGDSEPDVKWKFEVVVRNTAKVPVPAPAAVKKPEAPVVTPVVKPVPAAPAAPAERPAQAAEAPAVHAAMGVAPKQAPKGREKAIGILETRRDSLAKMLPYVSPELRAEIEAEIKKTDDLIAKLKDPAGEIAPGEAPGRLSAMQRLEGIARSAVVKRLEGRNAPKELVDEVTKGFASGDPALRANALETAGRFLDRAEDVVATAKALEEAGAPPELIRSMASAMEFYGKGPGWTERADLIVLNAKTYLKNAAILKQDEGQGALGTTVEVAVLLSNPEYILKDPQVARQVIGKAGTEAMEAAAGKRELARQTFMTSIVPLSGFLRVEWLKPLAPGIRAIIRRSAEISEKLADPARAAEVSEDDIARSSAGITAVGHMADRLEDCPAGTKVHLGRLYAAALDYLNNGGSVETLDLMIFTGDLLMDKRFAPYAKEFTEAVAAVRDAKTEEERAKAEIHLREVTAKAVATVLGKAAEGLPGGAGKSVKSISDGLLANPGGAALDVLVSAQNALDIVDRMKPRLMARGVPEIVRNEAGVVYGRALDTLANGGASAVVETQVRLAERYLDPAAENQAADDLERDELKKLSLDLDKEPGRLEQTRHYLTLSDDIAAIREKRKLLIKKGDLRAGSPGARALEDMLGYLEEKRKLIAGGSPVSEEDIEKWAARVRDRMASDENVRGLVGGIARGLIDEAAARGQVLDPKEAEDMALMSIARQKAESDFLKSIDGVKASANGLLGTLEILRKDDRAAAAQRAEAIQIYSYAAAAYRAGRIRDGAVFVNAGAQYGQLNNRDRSEVATICREAGERDRNPGESLFDGTDLDILDVYKRKSELMPSITTPGEWRNAEAHFDLAILAYRSGNPQAAAHIMDLAVLYTTWAGVPEKDLPPDLQKKRREDLDFVEGNLGDYSKDRNTVGGKRLIDAASAYGPPIWTPDSKLTPPIAAALLAGKPVAEVLGDGDMDAGATAFASVIDEKDRRMGALGAIDLERKAGALIGRNADEEEAREKKYKKEADWWAKKAAEAGDDKLLADYYRTQAGIVDRSFMIDSVAAARDARAKGIAVLSEAAKLESEAEGAASATVETIEGRLPGLIAGFPESERGIYEEAVLKAEGDPEKLRIIHSALLMKRAAELRQAGQDLIGDSDRIMKGLGTFDRSVRNLTTLREESGRYQLYTGVRISVAVTRDQDVDFLGNPISHEGKPTRPTPERMGMLRAQASAGIEVGAKAVAEQEGVQKRRAEGLANADTQIRKASIDGTKTAIANMIEFLPEWKREERMKQLDDAVAAATRKKDPDVSPLMMLYRDVCGDVGMPYMDSEGHLFINLEEDDKKYNRTSGLYWSERFRAADRALGEGAFHVRSEVARLDKWYSARNLRLSYQQSTGNAEDYVTYEEAFGLPWMAQPETVWAHLPPEKRKTYQKRYDEISKMEAGPEKDRKLDELRMEIDREPGFFKPNIWGHNPLTVAGIVPGTEVLPGELKPLGYEKYEAAATPALITTLITHLPADKKAAYKEEYDKIPAGPEGDTARRELLLKLKSEKINYPGTGRDRTIGDIVDVGYVPSKPGGPAGGYYGLNTLFYFDIEDYDKRIEKAQELAASGDVAGARLLLDQVERDARRAESVERRDIVGTQRRYRAAYVRAEASDFRSEMIMDPERGDGPRAKFEIGRANAFLELGLAAYEDSHERDALDWEGAAETNDRARDAMMPKMEGGKLIEGAAPLAMTPDRVVDLAMALPPGILGSKAPGDPFERTYNNLIRDVRSATERGDQKSANAHAIVLYDSIKGNPEYFARAYAGMQANPATAIPTESDQHLQLESDVQGAQVHDWSWQRGVAWKVARDHIRLAKDSWYRADSARKDRDEASEDTRWLAEHRAGPGKDKTSDALRRAAATDMALSLAMLDPATDYQAYDVLLYGREINGFVYEWKYDAPTGNWDDKPITIDLIAGEVGDMDIVRPHTSIKPVEYLFHANRLRWKELTSFTDSDLMREMRPRYSEKAVEETVIELARYGIRAKWDRSSKSYETSKWDHTPEAMEQAERGYGHFRLLESKLFGDIYSHPAGWGTDAEENYLDRVFQRFSYISTGVTELTDAEPDSQAAAIVRSNSSYEISVPLEINSDGVLVDKDESTKSALQEMKDKASHYRIYKGVKSFVKTTVGVALAAPTLGASLTLTIDEGATMMEEGVKMKEARGEWTFRAGLTFGGGVAMMVMPVGGYFTGLAGETAAAASFAAPISEEALLALPGNAAIVAAEDAALIGGGWGSRAFNFMFLPRGVPVAATTWGEKAGRALFGTADMPFAGRILHWTGTAMTVQGGVDMFAALPESIGGVKSGDMTLAEAIFGGVMAVVQPAVTTAYSVHLAEFGYRTGAPKFVPNWKRLLLGMPLESRSSQKLAYEYAMAEREFKALEPAKRESFDEFRRDSGYVFLPADEAHVLAAYRASPQTDFVAFAKANPGLVDAEALGRVGPPTHAGGAAMVSPDTQAWADFIGKNPDLPDYAAKRASEIFNEGPVRDAVEGAVKSYIEHESARILALPEAERPAAVIRMKTNADFILSRAATDPASAPAWAAFVGQNPELARYSALVREGRTASGQAVEFRPASAPIGDPVVAAAFGKSFERNPAIETAVAEIPVGWLDWVGIKRDDLLALVKSDPQKAMEWVNKALESHNMALIRNNGFFLAEVTHVIAPRGSENSTGFMIGKVYGKGDMFSGRHAMYNPNSYTVFLKGKKEYSKGGIPDTHLPFLRETYAHETQHLFDHAAGLLAAYSRATKGKGMAAMPAFRADQETTAVAREVGEMLYSMDGAQVGKFLDDALLSKRQPPEYKAAYERSLKALSTDEFGASDPGWRTRPPEVLRARLDKFIDSEYVRMAGIGYSHLYGGAVEALPHPGKPKEAGVETETGGAGAAELARGAFPKDIIGPDALAEAVLEMAGDGAKLPEWIIGGERVREGGVESFETGGVLRTIEDIVVNNAAGGVESDVIVISADKKRLNGINDIFGLENGDLALGAYRDILQRATAMSAGGEFSIMIRPSSRGDEVIAVIVVKKGSGEKVRTDIEANVLKATNEVFAERSAPGNPGYIGGLAKALRNPRDVVAASVLMGPVVEVRKVEGVVRATYHDDGNAYITRAGGSVEFLAPAATKVDDPYFAADLRKLLGIEEQHDIVKGLEPAEERLLLDLWERRGGPLTPGDSATVRRMTEVYERRRAEGAAPDAATRDMVALVGAERVNVAPGEILSDAGAAFEIRYELPEPVRSQLLRLLPEVGKGLAEAINNSFGIRGFNTDTGHYAANSVVSITDGAVAEFGSIHGVRIRRLGTMKYFIEGGTPEMAAELYVHLDAVMKKKGLDMKVSGKQQPAVIGPGTDGRTALAHVSNGHLVVERRRLPRNMTEEQAGATDWNGHTEHYQNANALISLMSLGSDETLAGLLGREDFARLEPIIKMVREHPEIRNFEDLVFALRDNGYGGENGIGLEGLFRGYVVDTGNILRSRLDLRYSKAAPGEEGAMAEGVPLPSRPAAYRKRAQAAREAGRDVEADLFELKSDLADESLTPGDLRRKADDLEKAAYDTGDLSPDLRRGRNARHAAEAELLREEADRREGKGPMAGAPESGIDVEGRAASLVGEAVGFEGQARRARHGSPEYNDLMIKARARRKDAEKLKLLNRLDGLEGAQGFGDAEVLPEKALDKDAAGDWVVARAGFEAWIKKAVPPEHRAYALETLGFVMDRGLERIAGLPPGERPSEADRQIIAVDYIVGRAADNPARAKAWFDYARMRAADESAFYGIADYAMLAKRGLRLTEEGMSIDRIDVSAEDAAARSSLGGIFGRMYEQPPAGIILDSLPRRWLSDAGLDVGGLTMGLEDSLRRADAAEKINAALAPHGLVLVDKGFGFVLAEVSHIITLHGQADTKAYIISKAYGPEAVFDPRVAGFFSRGTGEIFLRPIPEAEVAGLFAGDSTVKRVYLHELQHFFDNVSGFGDEIRRKFGDDAARMVDETTAIAREAIINGPEEGGRIAELYSRSPNPVYRDAAGRVRAAIAGGRLDGLLDLEYTAVLGLGFGELFEAGPIRVVSGEIGTLPPRKAAAGEMHAVSADYTQPAGLEDFVRRLTSDDRAVRREAEKELEALGNDLAAKRIIEMRERLRARIIEREHVGPLAGKSRDGFISYNAHALGEEYAPMIFRDRRDAGVKAEAPAAVEGSGGSMQIGAERIPGKYDTAALLRLDEPGELAAFARKVVLGDASALESFGSLPPEIMDIVAMLTQDETFRSAARSDFMFKSYVEDPHGLGKMMVDETAGAIRGIIGQPAEPGPAAAGYSPEAAALAENLAASPVRLSELVRGLINGDAEAAAELDILGNHPARKHVESLVNNPDMRKTVLEGRLPDLDVIRVYSKAIIDSLHPMESAAPSSPGAGVPAGIADAEISGYFDKAASGDEAALSVLVDRYSGLGSPGGAFDAMLLREIGLEERRTGVARRDAAKSVLGALLAKPAGVEALAIAGRVKADPAGVPMAQDIALAYLLIREGDRFALGETAPFRELFIDGLAVIASKTPASKLASAIESFDAAARQVSAKFPQAGYPDSLMDSAAQKVFRLAAGLSADGAQTPAAMISSGRSGLLDLIPLTSPQSFVILGDAADIMLGMLAGIPDVASFKIQTKGQIEKAEVSRGEIGGTLFNWLLADMARLKEPGAREVYLRKFDALFTWDGFYPQYKELLMRSAKSGRSVGGIDKLPILAYVVEDGSGVIPRGLIQKTLDNDFFRARLGPDAGYLAFVDFIGNVHGTGRDNNRQSKTWLEAAKESLVFLNLDEAGRKKAGIAEKQKDSRKYFIERKMGYLNELLAHYREGDVNARALIFLIEGIIGKPARAEFEALLAGGYFEVFGNDMGLGEEYILAHTALYLEVSAYRKNLRSFTGEPTPQMNSIYVGEKIAFKETIPVLDAAIHAESEGKFSDFKFSQEFHDELRKSFGQDGGEAADRAFVAWKSDAQGTVDAGGKRFEVEEASSFDELFHAGTYKGEVACQNPKNSSFVVAGLVGMIELPWMKEVVVSEAGGAHGAYKRWLVLVKDSETGKPILLVQPGYGQIGSKVEVDAAIIGMLSAKYVPLGIEVRDMPTPEKKERKALRNYGYRTYASGRAPFFYIDSNMYSFPEVGLVAQMHGLHNRESGKEFIFDKGWERNHRIKW